jgi:hypothetical protein
MQAAFVMSSKPKRDWTIFCAGFVVGALPGAYLGFRLLAHSQYNLSPSAWPLILFVGGGALIFGVLGAIAAKSDWHLHP